ncbi:MAG: superoxide dismutase family protein [Lentisphaeria bacterium]|nr:superoxide dismutase family protein [Candidatus Neomarinimicrobiota bacterium]MCF7842426.1 superoxide dismutase family protein [Lentisphaeria bacterium]
MMMEKTHDGHGDTCCDKDMPVFTKAVAVLNPTAGNTAGGIVTFTQTDSGVRVVVELTNVSPGNHGFHIHELGDISAPDGTSAGGHFNPAGMSHGGPMAGERHGGDMGNVVADENGIARLDYVDSHIKLNGPESIMGRGVILHADEDDLKSQPTGAAGARIASGVIGIAEIKASN